MDYKIIGVGASMLEIDLDTDERLVATEACVVAVESDLFRRRSVIGGGFYRLWRTLCLPQHILTLRLKNQTESGRHILLTHPHPGELRAIKLNSEKMCIAPEALIARFGAVGLTMRWAGVGALLAGRKPFDLVAKGSGIIWIGACGSVQEIKVDGHCDVDTDRLLVFSASLRKHYRARRGKLFGIRRDGSKTRIEGKGLVLLSARPLSTLATYVFGDD